MAQKQSGWSTFKAWVAEGAKDLHNHLVPAFPAFAHGVDEPGTPQNNRIEPVEARPSFEDRLAESVPQMPAEEPGIDHGMEL